jgi:hypothetical protein
MGAAALLSQRRCPLSKKALDKGGYQAEFRRMVSHFTVAGAPL